MNRSVVILSPLFLPSTMTGVHRARHLAKHLPAVGWAPTVLCVDEAYHEQTLDLSLLRLTPPTTEVVKVAALPAWVTRPFGLGDISLRAWFQFRHRLKILLRSRPVAAVMISAAPYYSLMLSAMVKRQFDIPVVLDFQDPWVSHWGEKQPRWSKAGFSHRLATVLEPRAVRNADFITSVSEVQNQEMADRYPWLDRTRMAAIPIGGDTEDFDHAASSAPPDIAIGGDGLVEFSYVGSYWPAAEEPFRVFMRGLARLQNMDAELSKRLRVNFVGTSYAGSNDPYRVRRLAESEGVGSLVRENPVRLPYLDALTVMRRSDGLILIGSEEAHYTASKIYPALISGQPYLSLFHSSSSAHHNLLAAGGGIALAFSNATELASLEIPIAEGLRKLMLAGSSLGKADPASYAAYNASAIARRYGEIFDYVCDNRRRR